MDEKNNVNPEEMEKPSTRMRAPIIRNSKEAEQPGTAPDTQTTDDATEKISSSGVRRPSFNLSVPSGIEDQDEEYEGIIRQFEDNNPVTEGDGNDPPDDPPVDSDSPDDDHDDDREKPVPIGKLKRMWNSRAFARILLGLSIVFFAVGIYFFVKPAIIYKNQEKAGKEILDLLENRDPEDTGEVTFEVNVDDVYIPGSYDESFDVIQPPGATGNVTVQTSPSATTQKPRTIVIKSDTVMKIPSIDYESAIAPDVKESTLWVLPGHFPPSVQPGEVGVAAYFGHRMIKRGLHFNRLNEMKVGDTIQIKRLGETYNFIVDDYRIVEPADVGQYVYERTDTSRILLVTCDPVIAPRSTKKRILVGGYLEGGLPTP